MGRGGPHARPGGQKMGPSHGETAGRFLGERTADAPHDPARPSRTCAQSSGQQGRAPRSEPTFAAALSTVAKRRGHLSVHRNPHMWGTQRAIPQVSEGAKDDGRTLRTWRRGKRVGRQTAAAAGPRSRERHPARRQDAGPQGSLAISCPVEGPGEAWGAGAEGDGFCSDDGKVLGLTDRGDTYTVLPMELMSLNVHLKIISSMFVYFTTMKKTLKKRNGEFAAIKRGLWPRLPV